MLSVIVGILLGNLLIGVLFAPALQELRKILRGFSTIQLPYVSVSPGADQMSPQQRYDAEAVATREFNRLFREYTISFAAFKKLGLLFLAAVIVLADTVAWRTPLEIKFRVPLLVSLVGLIVALGFYLQRALTPTPSQLVSIDFLQNNFANLHLSSIFDYSRLRVSLGRKLQDTVAHLSISQGLLFFGYRFLMAVSDERCSRVYFVAYGRLDGRIKYVQIWSPEVQAFSIPLGDFSLSDAIRATQPNGELQLHWWLFIPTPRGWTPETRLHPRMLSDNITSNMGGVPGIRLSLDSCSWRSVDNNIEFAHKTVAGFTSWRITRLIVPTVNSPQAILRRFKHDVENARGIKWADYPNGIDV